MRFSYHRRRAVAVSMVHASARQGFVAARDVRNEVTHKRDIRAAAWGNNAIQPRADDDVTTMMRRLELGNAGMKQKMAMLERRQNGPRGGPN